MKTVQKLGWAYAALFLFVVGIGYVPGLTDNQGMLLGLFKIDPIDDVIHTASGVWAALAAWTSGRASTWYFRLFGTFYTLDAVIGFLRGIGELDVITNFSVNLPHFIIGPLALLIGFWVGSLSSDKRAA